MTDFSSPSRLDHVLFVGGPPGVGKTTVASILARRHGLRLYSADTRTWVHRDRAIANGVEAAVHWESLSPGQRVSAADDELVAMSLHRERGAMVLGDLRSLPRSPLIVAEGTVIRPEDVPPGAAAVWLLSDARDQRQRLVDRDGTAFRLYELMLDVITVEVAEARAPVIQVGSIAHTVAALENSFAGQLARGPLATTVTKCRHLVREANLDIVNQVRGYYARPWAAGDPEAVVRAFLCECGATNCEAFVDATVGDASSNRVIEVGHDGRQSRIGA
ncbi:MAG TPA: hypothetical protein VH371_05245 [Candidatus Limnocylindrales bacterium]